MASRKVKRNTSKQIISYTLDPQGTDSYGTVKFPASKTVFGSGEFNKVLYATPTELINPIPSTELTIISEERLDLKTFAGVLDTFSATYLIPTSLTPEGNPYKLIRFPNGIADLSKNTRAGVPQNLQFIKTLSGQSQKTPGRYTITPELIKSGWGLRMKWKLVGENAYNGNVHNNTNLRRFRYGTAGSVSSTQLGIVSVMTDGTGDKKFYMNGEYIIENSAMIANDEWELQGNSGQGDLQSTYADRCWWKIEVVASGATVNEELATSNQAEKDRIAKAADDGSSSGGSSSGGSSSGGSSSGGNGDDNFHPNDV